MTKTATKHTVKINNEMCKGCGLCIAYCTKKVLRESESLNKAGYHHAEPDDAAQCSGCLICTIVCPEVVIEVYDE